MFAYTCDEVKEVDWRSDETLKIENVELVNLFRLRRNLDVADAYLQGMTVVNKDIVIATVNSDTNPANIYFIAHNLENKEYDNNFVGTENFEIKKVLNSNVLGHANDLTYNKDKNEVAIPYSKGANKYISTINLDDFSITDHNVAVNYYGISYQNDKKRYIAKGSPIYVLNDDYQVLTQFTIPLCYLTHQGMSYYNNSLFFSYYEGGGPSSNEPCHYSNSEKGSNLIVVYDISEDVNINEDKIIKSLYISNQLFGNEGPGELENTSFTDDGEMILGFNKSGKYIDFYKLKYTPASLKFVINLESSSEINNYQYKFKLMDSDNNLIQEQSNFNNKVVFDSIDIYNAGQYNYKIINEMTNEEYDVISKVIGNPLTLSYEEKTLYNGLESLNVNIESNYSVENIIDDVPNTDKSKNIIITICSLILIVVGFIIFKICKNKITKNNNI